MGNKEEKMGIIKPENRIYVLHGWTYSLEKWLGLEKILKKYGIELVFLRIPGLTSKTEKVWDIDKYAEWLKDQLSKDKNNQNKKINLLGHSNGGRIAIYFSAKYPERVNKLFLIDSAGIYHKELPLQIKRLFFKTTSKLGKKITTSNFLKSLLYKFVGEKDYKDASPEMKKTMLNLINFDVTPYLSKVKAKTTIIWARDDRITPLSDGKIMNKLIYDSKLVVMDETKHSPFYTNPVKVAEYIKNDF